MPCRLTRIVRGLKEHSEAILQDGEPFSTRHFVISQGPSGWNIEPRQSGESRSFRDALPPPTLNYEILTDVQPLTDDDRIEAGPSIWIFHSGDVARDDAAERAVLAAAPGAVAWQILSDWLQERGDPLGERIAQHLGQQVPHRALGRAQAYDALHDMPLPPSLRTGDAWFRLEAAEENGLWRTLIARSLQPENADDVSAMLHLRRARFLRHLVLDLADDALEVDAWVARIDAWPLPRWLETISFGTVYGTAPPAAATLVPPERWHRRCPLLRPEPLMGWGARAWVEASTGGPAMPTLPNSAIVRASRSVEIREHEPTAHAGRYYAFRLVGARWHLEASDVERLDLSFAQPMNATIGGRRVRRTPLLPGDRIEIEGGPTFVFRTGS